MIPYLLFENTMSVTKFQAMVAGLFQLKSAHEWVVTKKTGRQSELDLAALGGKPTQKVSCDAISHMHLMRRSQLFLHSNALLARVSASKAPPAAAAHTTACPD